MRRSLAHAGNLGTRGGAGLVLAPEIAADDGTAAAQKSYVDEWDERIILTAIPLDPARMPVLDAPRVESEVVIRRREA